MRPTRYNCNSCVGQIEGAAYERRSPMFVRLIKPSVEWGDEPVAVTLAEGEAVAVVRTRSTREVSGWIVGLTNASGATHADTLVTVTDATAGARWSSEQSYADTLALDLPAGFLASGTNALTATVTPLGADAHWDYATLGDLALTRPASITTSAGAAESTQGVRVQVAPNPASSASRLLVTGLASGQRAWAVVYDLLGREQQRIALDAAQSSVALSTGELPSGLYLVRIVAGGRVVASTTFAVAGRN